MLLNEAQHHQSLAIVPVCALSLTHSLLHSYWILEVHWTEQQAKTDPVLLLFFFNYARSEYFVQRVQTAT